MLENDDSLARLIPRIAREICEICSRILDSIEDDEGSSLYRTPAETQMHTSLAPVVREQMDQWNKHSGRGIDLELSMRDEGILSMLRQYKVMVARDHKIYGKTGNTLSEILDRGSLIKAMFDEIQYTLEHHEPKTYYAIHTILIVLNGYRQMVPDQQRPSLLPSAGRANTSAQQPKSLVNGTTTTSLGPRKLPNLRAQLIGSTCLASLVCLVIVALAFQAPSQKSEAPKSDGGFYMTVASSVLQLLGFYTTMLPICQYYRASAWRWSWACTVVGVCSVLAAIPVYLWLQPIWSALLSIVASVSQVFIVLQVVLLLPTEDRETQAKEE